MNEIKLSIIIPVYNSEKYLEECLDSLIQINEECFEIILINDGSKDKSSKICKEYISKLRNLRYYENKNSGCSATRNFGIKKSKGKYITFLDSDDYYLNNFKFSKLIKIMEDEKLDLLIFGYKKENNIKSIYFKPEKTSSKEYLYKSKLYFNIPWNKIYNKSILKDVYFPTNSHMGEDMAFNFIALSFAQKILVLDKIYYCYRDNIEGASYNPRKLLDIFKSFEYIFDFFSLESLDRYHKLKLKKLYIENAIIGPYIALTKLKEKEVIVNYEKILELKKNNQKNFEKKFNQSFIFFELYGQMRFKYSKIFKLLKIIVKGKLR